MISGSQSPTRLRLPPGIFCSKEIPSDVPTYAFRHEALGLLGRIVLREAQGGRIYITSEVASDTCDPSTAQRVAAFESLTRQIQQRLDELQDGSSEPNAETEKRR